jgi:hypothetical protein
VNAGLVPVLEMRERKPIDVLPNVAEIRRTRRRNPNAGEIRRTRRRRRMRVLRGSDARTTAA